MSGDGCRYSFSRSHWLVMVRSQACLKAVLANEIPPQEGSAMAGGRDTALQVVTL